MKNGSDNRPRTRMFGGVMDIEPPASAGSVPLWVSLVFAWCAGCSGSTTHGSTPAGKEGQACNSVHPCESDLKCVASPFDLNVCGRGCKSESECKDGEQCFSYSGDEHDGHCVSVVDKEYEKCGVALTSICSSKLTCLYLPQEASGLCVSTCALDGSKPNSGDEDAGVETDVDAGSATKTSTTPKGAVACADTQMCVDKVLADPDPNEGVCGTQVARGEPCGIERGIYCQTGIDICAPKDPNDFMSEALCFQDCSNGQRCDSGKCVNVQNVFAYCM